MRVRCFVVNNRYHSTKYSRLCSLHIAVFPIEIEFHERKLRRFGQQEITDGAFNLLSFNEHCSSEKGPKWPENMILNRCEVFSRYPPYSLSALQIRSFGYLICSNRGFGDQVFLQKQGTRIAFRPCTECYCNSFLTWSLVEQIF